MKTIEVTDEQYEFLKKMSEDMKNQNSRHTNKPLFCVYQKVEVLTPKGYSDDFIVFDGEENFYKPEEFLELLKNKEEFLDIFKCDEELYNKFIEEEFDIAEIADDLNLEVQYLEVEQIPVPGQVYFTEREAQDHIDRNHYHYKSPFTYVVPAWRNPEIEILMDVVYGIVNKGVKYGY